MAFLQLKNVSVSFPIYDANARSLKKRLVQLGSGGRIGVDSHKHITVEALRKVNLVIEHGDRVGLVGHNGAGKTTLLRVLAGIYEPSSGTVYREGQVAPLFDIGLGMDIERTGYENIMLRGLFLGLLPREIRARSEEIAEFTELGEYLEMPVRTYSSGMLLRLSFAVSTAITPEILLMDEWLSAGDAGFMKKAEARLDELLGRSGIMVLASHADELIRRNCNKALLMRQGQAVHFGSVDSVLEAYYAHASTPGATG